MGKRTKTVIEDNPQFTETGLLRILDKQPIQKPLSTIERLKTLDSSFAVEMDDQEATYLSNAERTLIQLSKDIETIRSALMAKLNSGEEISIKALTDMLDGLRKVSGSVFQQASLLSGRPTSITGHLSSCPECAKRKNMSEAELDIEIARYTRLIKNRGIDKNNLGKEE